MKERMVSFSFFGSCRSTELKSVAGNRNNWFLTFIAWVVVVVDVVVTAAVVVVVVVVVVCEAWQAFIVTMQGFHAATLTARV